MQLVILGTRIEVGTLAEKVMLEREFRRTAETIVEPEQLIAETRTRMLNYFYSGGRDPQSDTQRYIQ